MGRLTIVYLPTFSYHLKNQPFNVCKYTIASWEAITHHCWVDGCKFPLQRWDLKGNLLMVQKSGVANQLIRYISHYLQGILYIPRCCTISSINSISRIPMLKLQPHRFLQVVHAGATTVYPCRTTWPRGGGVSCKEDKHCALQLQDQHQQHQEQQEHQQD